MAVKKSFVSALPAHDAAAVPAADTAPVAEAVGRVVSVARGDADGAAGTVGLGTTDGGAAVQAGALASGVVADVAGDPHATAARLATSKRMAGRRT